MWNKSPPKIKHSSLIGNYEEGGYKVVNISTKLAALDKGATRWQLLSVENYPRELICSSRWLVIPSSILIENYQILVCAL